MASFSKQSFVEITHLRPVLVPPLRSQGPQRQNCFQIPCSYPVGSHICTLGSPTPNQLEKTREKIPDSLVQYNPSTEDQEFLHVCTVCTLDPPVPLLPSFLFRRKDGMSPSWSSSATHFGTFRRITCEQCVRISSCGMVDVAAGVQTHVLLCMSVCGTGSGLKRPVFTEVFW